MEEKKKASVARVKANGRYNKKTYYSTLVRFKKEDEERIRSAAGESVNGFIVECVLDRLKEIERSGESNEERERCPFL
nr:MAG TPA: Transcriptional repressor arc(10) helix, beta-ribbon, beta-sheet, structural [Bacteriophage sp.]